MASFKLSISVDHSLLWSISSLLLSTMHATIFSSTMKKTIYIHVYYFICFSPFKMMITPCIIYDESPRFMFFQVNDSFHHATLLRSLPAAFGHLSSSLKMEIQYLSLADFLPPNRLISCEDCRCVPREMCRDAKFPHIANLLCSNSACPTQNWWLCTICNTSVMKARKYVSRHIRTKGHKAAASLQIPVTDNNDLHRIGESHPRIDWSSCPSWNGGSNSIHNGHNGDGNEG